MLGSFLRTSVAALAMGTALVCVGPVSTASAAPAGDPGACAPNGRTSSQGPEYVCGLWKGNVPVYSWPFADQPIVGHLNQGGRANWFIGQCQSVNDNGTPAYFRDGPYYNSWWAYTLADNGRWGWVPLVYFSGGANDQQSAVLPSAC
ncbi:hypothetical protein ACIQI8_41840 [Streptomyces sp. NPDC092369]|uniref:hypothetical protein n=1 Tax=Streptomyces sp. NPDC092369 TaxID=3366015 RepID=UPI0037F7E596